jgi:ABC-type polysaccharide/polyol phosphate export permease
MLITFLTGLSALSLGILVSSITYTIPESIQLASLTFYAFLILTQFLFDPSTMHPVLRFVSNIIPFTYSVKAMREINILNMGFVDVWPVVVILHGSLAVFSTLSILALNRKAK